MEDLKIESFKLKYIRDFIKIYNKSFPKKERFSVMILLLNIIRKKSELFLLLNKEKFNILPANQKFNLEEYIELDAKISIWFLSAKANVVKI